MRTIKTLILALALVVLTTAGVAGRASAAAAPDGNVCGPSYTLVGSVPLVNKAGEKGGDLDVYWSSSLGTNCAVTQSRGEYRGVKKLMAAVICLNKCGTKHPQQKDYDEYYYYAGPVTMPARHQCVTVAGLIDKPSGPDGDPYMATARGWCD